MSNEKSKKAEEKAYNDRVINKLVDARNEKVSKNDTLMEILEDEGTDNIIWKVIKHITSVYAIDDSSYNEPAMLYACGKDVVIKVITDCLQGKVNAFNPRKGNASEKVFINYIWKAIKAGILEYCNSSDLLSVELPVELIKEIEKREKEYPAEINKNQLQSMIYAFASSDTRIKSGIDNMIAYWNKDRYQFKQTNDFLFLGAEKWMVGSVMEMIDNFENKKLPAQIQNEDKDDCEMISEAVMNHLSYYILSEYENYKSNELILRVRRKVRALESKAKKQTTEKNQNENTLLELAIGERYDWAMTLLKLSDKQKIIVRDFLSKRYDVVSLDTPLGDGTNEKTLGDLIPSGGNSPQYAGLSVDDLKVVFEERTGHIVFENEFYGNAFEVWKNIFLLKMMQEGDTASGLLQKFTLSEKKEVLHEIYGSDVEDDMDEEEIQEEYELFTRKFEMKIVRCLTLQEDV